MPKGVLTLPESQKKKMSETHKRLGTRPPDRTGLPSGMKGKKMTGRRKIGWKLTDEQKKNISNSHKGNKSFLWRGGITTPERLLWHGRQRRMRERNVGGFHSLEEWLNLKAQYNWTCPRCKKQEPEIKLTLDHIIPITKGGSNNIENIQPLCKKCNSSKNNRIIVKYEK